MPPSICSAGHEHDADDPISFRKQASGFRCYSFYSYLLDIFIFSHNSSLEPTPMLSHAFLIFCSPVHFRKRVWEGVFLTVYYNNWCCWQKCESCHHLQTVSSGMYRAKVNMSTTGKRTRIQGAEIAVETKSLSNSSRCVAIL